MSAVDRGRRLLIVWVMLGLAGTALRGAEPEVSGRALEIEVNARDLSRGLLRSRVVVPCEAGKLRLWFPKWIPGTHGPYGRVEDTGGLRITTADGKPIEWQRDEVELHCVACQAPAGTNEVVVHLDMICGDAGQDAMGHGSYGNPLVGIINWNSCLLYPEGRDCTKLPARVRLTLPDKWHYATVLKPSMKSAGTSSGTTGSTIEFEPVSLVELVDSPLIAGERLKTFKLDAGESPPATLAIASESEAALQLDPKVVEMYSKLVREAHAMFGAAHYPEYHFLVTCSDDVGYMGLEHHASSLNGVGERDLVDDSRRKGWIANLLPHEYVHSWCGKFRRPQGMFTTDFHTPQRTRLLWVYEGLTTYLANVLETRSGLATTDEHRERLAMDIGGLMRQEGRKWRSLEDTAVAGWMLRGGAPKWNQLRRGQDFYDEGMLLWLEADAIIRQRSRGERSLDDFCRTFFGPIATSDKVVPYELPDIVAAMKEVSDYDWDEFFDSRVSRPLDSLPTDVIGRCGYRLQYSQKPPASMQQMLGRGGGGAIVAHDSLGMMFSSTGTVLDVVPGRPGDKAGFAQGMQVIGVNGKKFSRSRFDDALADSVTKRKIEFLISDQEDFRTVAMDYADGPRYLELVRDNDKPDILAEILKPRGK